ncbi:hypothetical protein [Acinetobacter sp. P1(2025)]|uniref:hypothetical protein n=1 Tax=Acinetobacter sp. P1(2025) TaxID=3446120 RepID=UPI003F538A35
MKVLFKIQEQQFNAVMDQFRSANESDYYTVGEGAYNRSRYNFNEQNLQWFERAFVRHGGSLKNSVVAGYSIIEGGAVYRTSANNAWGVISENGEFYSFFSGARSVSKNIPVSSGEIVFYESSAPSDMLWDESEFDYVVRKGAEYASSHLAKNCRFGIPTEADSRALQDIYFHFENSLEMTNHFDSMIHAEMFKGVDIEGLFLKQYRNKKIDLAEMDSRLLVAWGMLDNEVQNRLLKW